MKVCNVFFVIFSLSILSLTSCDPEESKTEVVTIEILKPQVNAIIADPSKTEIEIQFSTEGQIHKFEILLTPKNNSAQKILDYKQTAHTSSLKYLHTADLSAFEKNTEFQLEVKACGDHDCTEIYTQGITFSL
jgi:hypothetical protein